VSDRRDDVANDQLPHFEGLYAAGKEPWSYGDRAVEMLRLERVAKLVGSLRPRRLLELGCSLGRMTERLVPLGAELTAVDLSPTAVRRARDRVRGATFLAGSATQLPLADGAFDVVLASDGLYSWQIERDLRDAALREIARVLAPGGRVVLTEHMRPVRFREFVGEVTASPLTVERVTYLYDRPCYQFEGLIKAFQHTAPAKALRRSVPLAKVLCALGRPFGAAGSRHIVVIASK
jgi:SAM-dependent methyltransferase